MNLYGQKGKEILLDLKRAEWLPPFDEEGIRVIISEFEEIYSIMEKIKNDIDSSDSIPPNNILVRFAYLQQCLARNKKYLNAFMTHRMESIRDLRWDAGPVLPVQISNEILSNSEREYYMKYSSILTDYSESIGFDITGDLEPPKDLMIEIKVLENCGKIMTESGPLNLSKGSYIYVKRAQVESFLREGKVEEVL